jgi:two-component sensor histidine kinase
MRRVATIALVHEMLSQTINEVVDFDEVFGRSLRLAADVASAGSDVRTERLGSFGLVRADDATALALVLTELVTNAVEHGLGTSGGTVTISAERQGQDLVVRVVDDGIGMSAPSLESSTGLGTQIVRTLVRGELNGAIDWHDAPGGGTEVVLHARLREMRVVPV